MFPDPSDIVDQWLAMHDDQPEVVEFEIDFQAAFKHRETCEYHCTQCPFLHTGDNAARAVCPATGEIIGEKAYDPACHDHFMRLYDGLYECDGCGKKVPGHGDSTLILCSLCQSTSRIIMQ